MNEIGRKITDKLIQIHGSNNFTICFMPYKRSMWNSISSVYDECLVSGIDAHCIPITYSRMKAGRQVDYIDSDFQYFGDIAEHVDVLDKIHVDYIALHYQYENHNRVTNMLPEYFTGTLKERYKCKIVFLPYGIGFGNAGSVCFYPGIREVDYLFTVSSESEILNFIEAWKTQGVDFTGRVFSYGSPKLDVAISASEHRIIPEEWRDIIGNRKVTLLCNTLASYLNNPYEALMAYKWNAIQEGERGHIVIFRPHPLLRTTITAMRAETQPWFDRLISDLSKMPHVIIDESEYIERAISCADYLISDMSSVVIMWQATGKPYSIIGE